MDKQDPRISVPPMSAQRDEPQVSSIPPIAEQDIKATESLQQSSSSSNAALIFMATLVLLITAGGAYWVITLQQQIENLQAINLSNQESMEQLRQVLSSTGKSATTSLDALSVKNDEQDFEIRKLWDVSNKRNKKQITANRETGKTLSSKLNKVQQESSKLDKQLTQVQTQQTKIQDLVKAAASAQVANKEELEQSLLNQNRSIAAMELSASQNRDDLQQLNEQFRKLQKQVSEQESADAILSIQLSLDDIQARLNAVEAR